MAIKRHPDFLKDYKKYKQLKSPAWKLRKELEIEKKWGECLRAIENAEKLKNTANPVKAVTIFEHDPIRLFSSRNGDDITDSFITGKRLYLEIDIINNTKDDIVKGVKRRLEEHQKALPKVKSRNRKFKSNMWELYDKIDEKLKEGLNLFKAVQEITGTKDYPTINEKFMRYYRKAQNAYNKAKKIIEAVEPPSI